MRMRNLTSSPVPGADATPNRTANLRRVCCAQNISALAQDPRDGLWKVVGGCSNITALPNITFILGGHPLPLRPDQYIMQVDNWIRRLRIMHTVSRCACNHRPHGTRELPEQEACKAFTSCSPQLLSASSIICMPPTQQC